MERAMLINKTASRVKNSTILLKEKIVAFLLVVSVFLLKPSFLGANLTLVGIAFIFIALVFVAKDFYISKDLLWMLFLISLHQLYMLILEVFTDDSYVFSQIKALFSIAIVFTLFYVAFKNTNVKKLFLKYFILILCFFSVSYMVSFILYNTITDHASLLLIDKVINNYEYRLTILFPFTPAHVSPIEVGGLKFLRLHSLFRECGIAQLFYLWGLVMAFDVFKNKRIIRIVFVCLLFGAVFCMSTTGFINVIIVLSLLVFFGPKTNKTLKVLILVFAAIFAYAFFNLEGIRFSDKNVVSSAARIDDFFLIIPEWKNSVFFGVGFNSNYRFSTCLLHMLNRIGVFGILLFYIPFIYVFTKTKNRTVYVISILPCLITLTFSQPIWEAPTIFILLLFYENRRHNEDSLLQKSF